MSQPPSDPPKTSAATEIRADAIKAATQAVTSPSRGLPPIIWVSGLVILTLVSVALLLA